MRNTMQADFSKDAVLDFWFEDSRNSFELFLARREIWFSASDEFDACVKSQFEHYIAPAASGQLSHWENDSQGLLALIIVMDQFPRNIYRGTSKAFANDRAALRVSRLAVDRQVDAHWGMAERLFAYLPFEHSEELEVQKTSMRHYQRLLDDSEGTGYRETMVEAYDYALLHYQIIDQFGRFPHRNEILGRASTEQETAFMSSGAETFGQVKK